MCFLYLEGIARGSHTRRGGGAASSTSTPVHAVVDAAVPSKTAVSTRLTDPLKQESETYIKDLLANEITSIMAHEGMAFRPQNRYASG